MRALFWTTPDQYHGYQTKVLNRRHNRHVQIPDQGLQHNSICTDNQPRSSTEQHMYKYPTQAFNRTTHLQIPYTDREQNNTCTDAQLTGDLKRDLTTSTTLGHPPKQECCAAEINRLIDTNDGVTALNVRRNIAWTRLFILII